MKHDFLIGSVQLNQAFESQGSSGSGGDGTTRRSFIKRTGAATVAAVVAFNFAERAYGSAEDGQTEVSYRYRLFVSEAPEVDDVIVSWAETSVSGTTTTPTSVEWKVTGSGPQPNDTAIDELTPIKAVLASGFANGTEEVTPKLERNDSLYDGAWLSGNDKPGLKFKKTPNGGLDPGSESSTLNVVGSKISAALGRPGVIWNGLTITSGETETVTEKHKTDDGYEVSGDAGVKAHYDTQATVGLGLRKGLISGEAKAKTGVLFHADLAGKKESSWQKETTSSGTKEYKKVEDIGKDVNANFRTEWVIIVQRQSRTQKFKKDLGGDGYVPDGPPVLGEWE